MTVPQAPAETVRIAYSLPRAISPAIQCSFCAYMWELYTTEFGWSMAEYGIISSWFYSGTQIISFLVFGGIFEGIEAKWNQDSNDGQVMAKRDCAKGILTGGTFFHWLTYFLLIYLPIKWHGVKTPYVDSLFDSASEIQRKVADGPVNLADMVNSGTMGRKAASLISIIYIPFLLIWWILYPFMKAFYVIVVNFGTIFKCCHSGHKVVESILPVLETLESIPPPACSACCNTTCCNNFAMRMKRAKHFMGTRTFLLYIITIVHGASMSAHELCNKALEYYIYPYKESGGNSDENQTARGTLSVINLAFFLSSNFVIYMLFSLLKLYVRNKNAFTETFFLISIVFFLMQIALMPPFVDKTQKPTNVTGDAATGNPNPLKVICLTVWHATILFWMFSGAQLTNYVANVLLGGDVGIMSFGVMINFAGLAGASVIFSGLTQSGNTTITDFLFDNGTKIGVTIACIVCELFMILMFFKHDWWWNKGNWVHYVLLIVIGGVNSIFVAYTNIMFSGEVVGKTNKCIAIGIFYSGTNAAVSFSMYFMFKSFGKDISLINFAWRCVRMNLRYNFPNVYIAMTLLFIIIDAIFAYLYFRN